MIDISKRYKFILFPHIYCSQTTEGQLLLYNTQTGSFIERKSLICQQLIDNIYEPANLGVIELSDDFLNNTESFEFINDILEKEFGKLIEIQPDMPKIVNLLPILSLQNDIDKMKKDGELEIGENALRYVNELNIYLNSDCRLDCKYCNLYHRQTKCCTKNSGKKAMEISKIKEILAVFENTPLKKINFLGGNILSYPYLNELITLINNYSFDLHFYIHIENIFKSNFPIDLKRDIIINFPANIKHIAEYINIHINDSVNFYHFLVESEIEYERAEEIIHKYKIDNYKIIPVYNETNISFFEENIYITKEDIFSSIIPHRIIFCNQKLNSNFFGKMHLFADGTVSANPNTAVLGNLFDNSFYEIINNELNRNTAWRLIRNNEVCNCCLYRFLCPAPSNYEFLLKKHYLCNIK
jgi:pseudo-rSAM protein